MAASDEEKLLTSLRLTEQGRQGVVRASVERCELWIVLVTVIPWIVTWAIVINFYPTEAMLVLLAELAQRGQ